LALLEKLLLAELAYNAIPEIPVPFICKPSAPTWS